MKSCKKCGQIKPLSAFYENSNKCKECTCEDVRNNYASRRAQYSAYYRRRAQRPDLHEIRVNYQRERNKRNPEKYKARNALNNAVRDGRIQKQGCEVCGGKAQAHHEDYSKPLEVRWLCFEHHREEHGQVIVR